MDSDIKEELTCGMVQLKIETENPCHSSSSYPSLRLDKMKQFHADECSGSFVLPFGATIGVDQEGISVFKDGSTTRCFFHGLKVFAAKTVQSRIVVTVKGIIQQNTFEVDGETMADLPDEVNLTLKFKVFMEAHRFVTELIEQGYTHEFGYESHNGTFKRDSLCALFSCIYRNKPDLTNFGY